MMSRSLLAARARHSYFRVLVIQYTFSYWQINFELSWPIRLAV